MANHWPIFPSAPVRLICGCFHRLMLRTPCSEGLNSHLGRPGYQSFWRIPFFLARLRGPRYNRSVRHRDLCLHATPSARLPAL